MIENTILSSRNANMNTQVDTVSDDVLPVNEIGSLMDKFANGFGIFLASEERLKPLFCSERLLKLLNITQEQFATHLSREQGYAIHPDDLEHALYSFTTALSSGSSVQDALRLRTGDGKYRYITVFANAHHEQDGKAKLYCIFSDAEEGEYLQRIQENRHRHLMKKRSHIAEGNVAYILLNISTNTCGESFFKYETVNDIDHSGTVDEFFESLASNIFVGEYVDELKRNFSLDFFRKDMEEGNYFKQMRIPLLLKGTGVHWHQLRTEMFYNPETGDTEVFAVFDDIDNETRLGYVVERVLSNEYEYLCQIDVQTGCVTRVGNRNTEDKFQSHENGRIRYRDVIQRAIQHLLPVEFWEEGGEILSLDAVIRALKTAPSYVCTFPVVLEDGNGERICQWSFEYADTMRSTILMCRSNISKYIEHGYDASTGMFARNGFCKRVRLELNSYPNRKYHLIEIDLDNFSLISKMQGYNVGTRFLRRFGADIRRRAMLLGRGTVVGHLEADHFAILLPTDCGVTPESLYSKIASQVDNYPGTGNLRLRMGIYEITDTTYDVGLMCDCAHLALQHCKSNFKKKLEYYSSSLRDKMLDDQILLSEMQNALDTEQFEIWFQPQINHARNGSLIGAEALVRWKHPKRGLVSPAVFVPLFENNGFIYELDKYVWSRVCRHIRNWLDEGKYPVPVSVNISRIDIMQDDFLESITAIIEEHHIPHELIHLEVTESAFADDGDKVVEIVRELIARGFTIAIDDFGSGYSSLSMLQSVPAQILKLDMRFFERTDDTLRNECIIESVISMAKMLGMAVLAEGVELLEQADFLRSVGCYYIQGYLYSKPLPYDDYVAYAGECTYESPQSTSLKTRSEKQEEKNRSYELFRSIISGSNDIIVVADVKTKQLLYANRAAEQYFGKAFDPMIVATCSDYCNQSELCKNCPANNLKLGEQTELVSGSMKSLYTRIDWNGHDAFVFYQVDISDELRELEFINSLIRNIPGATIVFHLDADNEAHIHYVSKQAMDVFRAAGFTGDDPDFEDCFTVLHPDDRAQVREAADKTFTEKCPFHQEFRVVLKDGGVMWLDMLINPVADSNGIYLFYGVYTDVTVRKAAQDHKSEILRGIPAAMTIYEIRGESMSRVFISNSARKLLMTSDDEYDRISEDLLYKRVHEDDRQRVWEFTKECFRSKKPFSCQFRLVGENGKVRWVQLDSSPIEKIGGDVHLFYSIYTDIDAQKRLETDVLDLDSMISIQDAVNFGLRTAMMQDTVDASIESILDFVGQALHADRANIVEKNADGTDSNTFEWVAPGITPVIDSMQRLPASVCSPLYEQFRGKNAVIIKDIEDIRYKHPRLYEELSSQNIRSLIAAPLMDDLGEPMGFFALDNPPEKAMTHYTALAQNVAFFIEAELKRKNLKAQLSL